MPHVVDCEIKAHQEALFRAGVNVDLVPPDADFDRYRLLLTPCLQVLPDALAERLEAFVRAGGVLLADTRFGVKDEHNRCHPRTLPGKLAKVFGIVIPEYDAIGGNDWHRDPAETAFPLAATAAFPGDYTCHRHVDWIEAKGAEVLLRHTAWHLQGHAALTRHRCGQGQA